MRRALFMCRGTGKLIYFEELSSSKLRYLMGYNSKVNNATQAVNWLLDNGVDRVIKGNFEHQFDTLSKTQMRCLLHDSDFC